jgi:ribosome-binding protein aMBF1 (putative translation factor)
MDSVKHSMNKREKRRLYIIVTKLQDVVESSDRLNTRLRDANKGVEEKLKEEAVNLGEKLEEVYRDLHEFESKARKSQEPTVRYDLNRIVKERLIRGWTQQVLAKNSKLHRATVSAILKRGRGSPEKIQALAKAVGLELADLIVDE